MTDLPILFSGPLVLAIQRGHKTETRRIVRDPSPIAHAGWPCPGLGVEGHRCNPPPEGMHHVHLCHSPRHPDRPTHWASLRCPYGVPGGTLWVREAWATAKKLDAHSPTTVGDMCLDAGWETRWAPLWYKADDAYNQAVSLGDAKRNWGGRGRWRPSIHMPRWASRISLTVEEVRLEPLHAIDRAGAVREGLPDTPNAREQFRALWDTINRKRSPWESNPWVWVVRFRPLGEVKS